MRRLPARLQVRGGHQVADRQSGSGSASSHQWASACDFHQRVVAEHLGHTQDMQHLEQPGLHPNVGLGCVLCQVFGELGSVLLQCAHQAIGQVVLQHLLGRLIPRKQAPEPVKAIQRSLESCGWCLAQSREMRWVEFGAVHQPCALDQVVRLVNEQPHAPGLTHGQRPGVGAEIEEVVEVAHHHVAPAQHVLPQVVGANAVFQRHGSQTRLVQPRGVCCFVARLRQPVVKAAGQRARVAVAGLVGVLTSFLPRHALQHPQTASGVVGLQPGQCIQRKLAARCLGGEVEQFVGALCGHRPERTKQRGHGFTDAGGRLHQQVSTLAVRAPRGAGQIALAVAKTVERKAQRFKLSVARAAMGLFAARPVYVALAQSVEVLAQLIGGVPAGQCGFGLGVDVEVHQRHLDALQPELLAQHPSVHAGLRPMQRAVVVAHQRHVATVGLDFFQPWDAGVETVGAALNEQVVQARAQRNFALVGCSAACGHRLVASHAVLRGGRGREAQVEIARLRGERAQHPHSNLQFFGRWQQSFVFHGVCCAVGENTVGGAPRSHGASLSMQAAISALAAQASCQRRVATQGEAAHQAASTAANWRTNGKIAASARQGRSPPSCGVWVNRVSRVGIRQFTASSRHASALRSGWRSAYL